MKGYRYAGMFRAGLVLAVLALAGCAGPAREPDVFVLGDAAPARATEVSQLNDPVVELRPVRIPDYLDTTDILVRQADGRVIPSASGHWGERLSIGMTRAVALALTAHLPNVTVTRVPPIDDPRWQVTIFVDAFEVRAGGECVLAGRWTVRQGREGAERAEERFSLVTPVLSQGDAAVVAAMTHQVDELAVQIAARLDGSDETRSSRQ